MTKTKKLLALLMAAVMVLGLLPAAALAETVEKTDTLKADELAATNTTYTDFSGVTFTSDAVYAGNSAKNDGAIQLRSRNSNSGIVTTASGGKVKSITIAVKSGSNTLDIYGKNTAYDSAADLYDSSKQGTKLGSLNADGTVTVTGDYKYVGLRSNNGAVYLSSINIVWETEGSSGDDPQPETYTVTAASNNPAYGTVSLNDNVITATPAEGYYAAGYSVSPDGAATVVQNGNTFTVTATADCTVTINFAAKTQIIVTYNGSGGTGSMDRDSWYAEDLYTVRACAFSKEGNVFTGWTINGGDGTVYQPGQEIMLDSDTEFVANWSDASTYNKITGATQLTNGTYLFVAVLTSSNKLFNGTTSTTGNFSDVTIENDTITGSFAAQEIVIESMDGGYYSLKNSENKYLKSPGSNGITFDQNAAANTIVFEDGVAYIRGTNDTTRCLQLNSASSPQYFRYYRDNGNYAKITLFKKASETPVTQYTVTLKAGDGEGTDITTPVDEGASYELPACPDTFVAPEGKVFVAWKVGDDATLRDPGYTIANIQANIDVVAQWKDLPATTAATLMSTLPNTGDKVVIFNPAYGKALDACGTNGNYNAGVDCTPVNYVINATDNILWDVTKVSEGVYKFSQNGQFLSLDTTGSAMAYDKDNDEWTVSASGSGYTIKNNGRNTYMEWYAQYSDFSTYSPATLNDQYVFEFYAVGGEAPTTYNVSFDANGGSGTMDPVTTTNANYTLPACGFTAPEGFVFAGWTIQGGNGEIYAAGAQVELTGDTTFVAQWTNNTKTYQLVTNEGQLAAGAKYIMVGVDSSNAAWALSNPRYNENSEPYYRALIGVTINNGKIELPQSQIATSASDNKVFELTLGGSAADGWTFHDGFNGYLCATGEGTDQNYMGFQTEVTADGKFVVAIGTDGMVRATAKSDRISRQIRYNSDVQRFSCYKTNSHTKFFYLYKLVDPAPDGYYLVGSMTNWQIDPMMQFTPNPGNASEMMLDAVLAVNDELKVVKLENGNITYYPDNAPNYEIGVVNAGNVTIYFRQDGQGGNGWHYGYIYIAPRNFFKTQNLILSGQIGVQFFVDLSGLEPEEKAAAKVSFEITGKGKDLIDKGPLALDENNHNANWYYGFACKVNAIQMADTITATLHYGDNQTIEKTYSVKDYVEAWDVAVTNGTTGIENETLRNKTTALIHALADYGHYVQLFLKEVNHWTLGTDYAAMMEDPYTGSYTVSTVQSAVAEYQMTAETTGAFKAPGMSLVLDSETAIRIFLAHEDGSMLDVNSVAVNVMPDNEDVAWDAETQLVKTQKGNRVMVEIKGIKAAWLAETFTITAEEGDNAQTINVSALSYVGRLLASEAYADNAAAQNAVCALYYYAMAAKAYNE